MLPNISQSDYLAFKNKSYRKTIFKTSPVNNIDDIVQLGYLDVHRTMARIDNVQSQNIKLIVITFINYLQSKPTSSQSEFDERHHQCCTKCVGYPGTATIHYGQAQKIINMSLKYWYNEFAIYYKLNRSNCLNFTNNMEFYFHLPIDNNIIDALTKCLNLIVTTSLPWSQWTHNHYITYQLNLRGKLPNGYKALEMDYLLWQPPTKKPKSKKASNRGACGGSGGIGAAQRLKGDIISTAKLRGIDPFQQCFAPKDLGLKSSDYGSFADYCKGAKSVKYGNAIILKACAWNKRNSPTRYLLI